MDPSIIAESTDIGIKQTGTEAHIPDSPLAKLMFYLRCICHVLNLEESGDIGRLTNYNQYYQLTDSEIDQLLILSILLSPDVLKGKCIFEDEAMSGNSQNQFYELSAVQNRFLVTSSILVGDQQRHVKKIMVYKPIFLLQNYLNPIVHFQDRLRVLSASLSAERQHISYQNTDTLFDTQPELEEYTNYSSSDSEKCHEKICLNLCISLIFPPWIFIWFCMCVCSD